MVYDERYGNCPECNGRILIVKNSPFSDHWCGFCKNCRCTQFIKDSNDMLIKYCPICGEQLKDIVKNKRETRCVCCGYKFEIYIPDEK